MCVWEYLYFFGVVLHNKCLLLALFTFSFFSFLFHVYKYSWELRNRFISVCSYRYFFFVFRSIWPMWNTRDCRNANLLKQLTLWLRSNNESFTLFDTFEIHISLYKKIYAKNLSFYIHHVNVNINTLAWSPCTYICNLITNNNFVVGVYLSSLFRFKNSPNTIVTCDCVCNHNLS